MADLTPPQRGAASGHSGPDRPGSSARAYLKLGAFLAVVAGGFLLALLTPVGRYLSPEGIGLVIDELRASPWAPVIFIALYATATALAIPGTILTLAGGALFGLFWGTVFNSIAANLGANAAFLVARALGREGVERIAGSRLEKLDEATRAHGFRALLTLRLIPLVPFNALNFGAGLTAIRWPTYALATMVGILPGTIVYTMFADALLEGSREASSEAFIRVLVSGGLLVLLSFLPTILKRFNVRVFGSTQTLLLAAALTLGAAPAAASAQDDALPGHEPFSRVLERVVRDNGVDYATLQAGRAELDAYLATLAAVDPAALERASHEARLAFWINAYNACMLRLVVDHYPIRKNRRLLDRVKNAIADRPENSVWQIPDVFTREHCRIAGRERSQDQIEHEIIRPMGDPRIHFAVNCAARSCPPLTPEAYEPETLEAQLDARVKAFVASARHFSLDPGPPPTVRLNKVLDWFKEDFGGIEGLRTFLAPYLEPEAARVLADPGTRVEFFEYDWTLNDVDAG